MFSDGEILCLSPWCSSLTFYASSRSSPATCSTAFASLVIRTYVSELLAFRNSHAVDFIVIDDTLLESGTGTESVDGAEVELLGDLRATRVADTSHDLLDCKWARTEHDDGSVLVESIDMEHPVRLVLAASHMHFSVVFPAFSRRSEPTTAPAPTWNATGTDATGKFASLSLLSVSQVHSLRLFPPCWRRVLEIAFGSSDRLPPNEYEACDFVDFRSRISPNLYDSLLPRPETAEIFRHQLSVRCCPPAALISRLSEAAAMAGDNPAPAVPPNLLANRSGPTIGTEQDSLVLVDWCIEATLRFLPLSAFCLLQIHADESVVVLEPAMDFVRLFRPSTGTQDTLFAVEALPSVAVSDTGHPQSHSSLATIPLREMVFAAIAFVKNQMVCRVRLQREFEDRQRQEAEQTNAFLSTEFRLLERIETASGVFEAFTTGKVRAAFLDRTICEMSFPHRTMPVAEDGLLGRSVKFVSPLGDVFSMTLGDALASPMRRHAQATLDFARWAFAASPEERQAIASSLRREKEEMPRMVSEVLDRIRDALAGVDRQVVEQVAQSAPETSSFIFKTQELIMESRNMM